MSNQRQSVSEKSKAHLVRQISPSEFQVISGGSGNCYNVKQHDGGFRCTCRFGNPFNSKWGRRDSGCSHVASVKLVLDAERVEMAQAA